MFIFYFYPVRPPMKQPHRGHLETTDILDRTGPISCCLDFPSSQWRTAFSSYLPSLWTTRSALGLQHGKKTTSCDGDISAESQAAYFLWQKPSRPALWTSAQKQNNWCDTLIQMLQDWFILYIEEAKNEHKSLPSGPLSLFLMLVLMPHVNTPLTDASEACDSLTTCSPTRSPGQQQACFSFKGR